MMCCFVLLYQKQEKTRGKRAFVWSESEEQKPTTGLYMKINVPTATGNERTKLK